MTTHELYHGTWPELARDWFKRFDCVFMDPPDNLRLPYVGIDDNLDNYVGQLRRWYYAAMQVCHDTGTVWASFNARHITVMSKTFDDYLCWEKQPILRPMVQVFTFGQNQRKDFVNGHRPLWRVQMSKDAKIRPENILVESWRQKNGDKRAAPGGKMPDDVFYFPRVTGNSKQRRRYHPTQLHEGLVERCILSCTDPGDTVLDLFSGTGTAIRVCKRIGRNTVSVEASEEYCRRISEEHGLTVQKS